MPIKASRCLERDNVYNRWSRPTNFYEDACVRYSVVQPTFLAYVLNWPAETRVIPDSGETTALISTHAQPIPTRSSCSTAGQPFAFP